MIKDKRKALGYTQEQMADVLGISLRQYARIDKEEDLPRKDILKKIINVFNLSNEEIGQYLRNIVEKQSAPVPFVHNQSKSLIDKKEP